MKQGILEGLLFVTGEDGITLNDIENILDVTEDEALALVDDYQKSLEDEKRGVRLAFLGNKYKLITKVEHKKYYESLVDKVSSLNFSQSALETMAIIAYKEPISVGMIDEIRGVSSRDIVRKLLYRGFIEMAGKSDMAGKPMLYKTTDKFLDYFNLSSLSDLPKLKEVDDINVDEDLFMSKYKE